MAKDAYAGGRMFTRSLMDVIQSVSLVHFQIGCPKKSVLIALSGILRQSRFRFKTQKVWWII